MRTRMRIQEKAPTADLADAAFGGAFKPASADDGGICEDGSPDQIFDHPLKESTRRFVRRLKVLELKIESRDYDFPETSGIIEQYCNKNQIPWKSAHRTRLAFEELVQQMLLARMPVPKIGVVIEYAEAEETVTMTVRYAGEAWDVTKEGDALPLRVLKSAADQLSWHFTENGNEVILRIIP